MIHFFHQNVDDIFSRFVSYDIFQPASLGIKFFELKISDRRTPTDGYRIQFECWMTSNDHHQAGFEASNEAGPMRVSVAARFGRATGPDSDQYSGGRTATSPLRLPSADRDDPCHTDRGGDRAVRCPAVLPSSLMSNRVLYSCRKVHQFICPTVHSQAVQSFSRSVCCLTVNHPNVQPSSLMSNCPVCCPIVQPFIRPTIHRPPCTVRPSRLLPNRPVSCS